MTLMSCSRAKTRTCCRKRSRLPVGVRGICREHLVIGAAVKVLLLVLAELGYCTLWFAAVLDGAAVLGTLLMAIRASVLTSSTTVFATICLKIKSE